MNQVYPYGTRFQFQVLCTVLQDPQFLRKYRETVQPQYFENPDHQSVARLVLEFYQKYDRAPSADELKVLLQDSLTKGNASREEVEHYLTLHHELFNTTIDDPQFLTDKIVAFAQRQSLKIGVQKIIGLLDDETKYEEARSIIDRALVVGAHVDTGLDLGVVLPDLPKLLRDSQLYNPARKIRTLLPTLDRLMHGGLSVTEFGVLIGPKGHGKSTVLSNFGVGAVLQQHPVLHITMENKELDVALMYAARLLGITRQQIVESNGDLTPRLIDLRDRLLGPDRLRIKYFSPGSLSASGLRSLISYLRGAEGFHPRLLILDYLKQMKVQGDYMSYGELVNQIIGVLDDFDMGCWTAHQGQRQTIRAEQVRANEIGDSIQIIEKADVVITLSQTDAEKSAGTIRFGLDHDRRGSDGFRDIKHKIDYSRATVKEDMRVAN